MAVDLSDYTDSLVREVADPSVATADGIGALTSDDLVGHLADAFWEARLDGLLPAYTCDADGLVTPLQSGGTDMTRDLVQLVVLYASFRIIRNILRNLRTAYRAQSGPVSIEYQQSANLLTEIMKDIINRRDMILVRLSDLGTVPVYITDSLVARDESIMDSLTWWPTGGANLPDPYRYSNLTG